MTEREKMLKGESYNPMDKELIELRSEARGYCRAFNNTKNNETDKRKSILKNLLGSRGAHSVILPKVDFDYGVNTYIGDDCFFNFNTTFLDSAEIHFGNNVFVGPNCSFYTAMHPMLSSERKYIEDENGKMYSPEFAKPINIGNDVWLGGDITVLGGVTIGAGTVIGAGSVVSKDIPENVFAAGNPCKVIRELGEEDKVLFD